MMFVIVCGDLNHLMSMIGIIITACDTKICTV